MTPPGRTGLPAEWEPGVVEIIYLPAGEDPAGVCLIADGREVMWFTREGWEKVRNRVDYIFGRMFDDAHTARVDLDGGGGV